MAACLDHVIVAVADLDAAAAAYTLLLGRGESWRGSHPQLGTRNVLFRLDDGCLELLAAGPKPSPLSDEVQRALDGREERPFGLALRVSDVAAAVDEGRARGIHVSDPSAYSGVDERSGRERRWRSAFVSPDSVRGLRLLLIEHLSPADALPMAPATMSDEAACGGFDHVVVFTADLPAAAARWTENFGAAESWQHDFPERHTRNLGLELGETILELISRTDQPGKPIVDKLWGLAYRVVRCDAICARLRAANVPVDEPRPGLVPGTRVVTVRWSRTPTLLIER